MMLSVRTLGAYAATPRKLANLSAQYISFNRNHFLIDCGEGTQRSLRACGVNLLGIQKVFISHLHGDHFYGLPGLITTMNTLKRTDVLEIYGPKGIKEILTLLLKASDSWTRYPLKFVEIESSDSEVVFESNKVRVSTIPLNHRVYTNGFLFEVYELDRWSKLYAYCSDTAFLPKIASIFEKVYVLYHESTFLETELHLCEKTKHSTASQAGKIAQIAQSKFLILGHYSTRYKNLDLFKIEAMNHFNSGEVLLADDHELFEFPWPQKT
jgi:ribonuclease Z